MFTFPCISFACRIHTFIIVSSAVTPTDWRELEGALAGALIRPLHRQGLHLLPVLLLGTRPLPHPVDVTSGDALLLAHQTLVCEGDVPQAVSSTDRRQDLWTFDGFAPSSSII